jgi:hypothetical protein
MSGVSKGLPGALEEDGQCAPEGHNNEEAHLSLYARDRALEMVWNGRCVGRKQGECTETVEKVEKKEKRSRRAPVAGS